MKLLVVCKKPERKRQTGVRSPVSSAHRVSTTDLHVHVHSTAAADSENMHMIAVDTAVSHRVISHLSLHSNGVPLKDPRTKAIRHNQRKRTHEVLHRSSCMYITKTIRSLLPRPPRALLKKSRISCVYHHIQTHCHLFFPMPRSTRQTGICETKNGNTTHAIRALIHRRQVVQGLYGVTPHAEYTKLSPSQ